MSIREREKNVYLSMPPLNPVATGVNGLQAETPDPTIDDT